MCSLCVEHYTSDPALRTRALRLLEVLSVKSNEVLEQFVIGFNEGKRDEILKYLQERKEGSNSSVSGDGRVSSKPEAEMASNDATSTTSRNTGSASV